jgi:hypothetical protein
MVQYQFNSYSFFLTKSQVYFLQKNLGTICPNTDEASFLLKKICIDTDKFLGKIPVTENQHGTMLAFLNEVSQGKYYESH